MKVHIVAQNKKANCSQILYNIMAIMKANWHADCCMKVSPGSPDVQTRYQKEWGEPNRTYHMRSITGSENLWTNK